MKSLTIAFFLIFVLGLYTSCEPDDLSEDIQLKEISETGNQEDSPDDEKK